MEIGENYFTMIMVLHKAGENHPCDYFKVPKRKFLEPEGLPVIPPGNTALFHFQKNCP